MKFKKYMITVMMLVAALFLVPGVQALDHQQEWDRIDNAFFSKLDAAALLYDQTLAQSEAVLFATLDRSNLTDAQVYAAYAAHDHRVSSAEARYNRVVDAAYAVFERAHVNLEQRLARYEAEQEKLARQAEEEAERQRIREEQERPERERQAEIDAQRERERLATLEPGDFRSRWGYHCSSNVCLFPVEDNLSVVIQDEDGAVIARKQVSLSGYHEDGRGTDGGHIANIHSMSRGDSYISWGYWAYSEYGPLSHDHRIVRHHDSFAGGNHPAHNVAPVLGTATYHGRLDGIASISHSGEKWTKAFHDQYIRLDADFDENTIRGWGTLHVSQQGPWINRMMPAGYVNPNGIPPRPHWGRWGASDLSLTETALSPEGMFSGHGTARSSHGEAYHAIKWGGRLYHPADDVTEAPYHAAGGLSVNRTFNAGHGFSTVNVTIDAAFGAAREQE